MPKTNIRTLLIFLIGLLVGQKGSEHLYEKYISSKKEADNNQYEVRQSDKNKKRQYIRYDEIGEKNDSVRKGSDREVSNTYRSSTDREHLSELVRNKEYVSQKEAESEVEGPLHLVNEYEEFSDTASVNQISPIEFIEAVSHGAEINTFIFNTIDQKFYWDLNYEPISDHEIKFLIGKDLKNDIIRESNLYMNHWVHTRYAYNLINNQYIRVEAKTLTDIDRKDV